MRLYTNEQLLWSRGWNWIHLMKFKCDICESSGSMRSEVRPFKLCCGREVTWLE